MNVKTFKNPKISVSTCKLQTMYVIKGPPISCTEYTHLGRSWHIVYSICVVLLQDVNEGDNTSAIPVNICD